MSKVVVSFWCDKCKEDFDNEVALRDNGLAKWFETRCRKCGEKSIRYADFPKKDPYFHKSLKIKRMFHEFSKDLIQPGDPRYQIFYKKQYDELEKSRELYYNKQIKDKKEKDKYYEKFSYDINKREAVKAAMEAEEKLNAK